MIFTYQQTRCSQSKPTVNFFIHKLLTLMVLFSCLVANYASADTRSEDVRQLLQLTEYIGVDYAAAVVGGKVKNQSEFKEMLEFSSIIAEKSVILKDADQSIVALALSLQDAVNKKQSIENIRTITAKLKTLILKHSPQLSLPNGLLSRQDSQLLFQDNCSSCHGMSGQGDGPLAKQLVPKPVDFTDHQRALNRSILGLYNIISTGLDSSAMPSFNQLTAKQRWSLAFYVGSLGFTEKSSNDKTQNKSILLDDLSLEKLVMFSPNELLRHRPKQTYTMIKQFRINPNPLFVKTENPLAVTHNQLADALIAYQQKDFVNARRFAVSAYLDGFELIENSLDTHDVTLRKDIESKLLHLRSLLNDKSKSKQVEQSVSAIFVQLDEAQRLLTTASMSNATLFSASFIILLREGLEALLVVIALLTILLRSNKKAAVRYVHLGWVAAMLVGLLTWIAAQKLITITGANREIMEGVAASLAAGVLFYVGFWMHSKTQADQWQRYIQQSIDRSLKAGTLWGIFGLAFIAVYREVFETVLFYESLLTQTASSQVLFLIGGFGCAILVLILLTWLMIRYSIKLPISQFFYYTTFLLLALSFILAGKAILALQEAALINSSVLPVDFQISWLGINPTWQGISVQFCILILSLLMIFKRRLKLKLGTSQHNIQEDKNSR